MRRLFGLALIGSIALGASACGSNPGSRALSGALIGGTTGAIVGGLFARHPTTGALVGGAIGATTGAIIGAATTPSQPASPSLFGWL